MNGLEMRCKWFSKLIKLLRTIKLGKRLFLSLVIIFILSVLITGSTLYKTSKDIVLSKTHQYLSNYTLILQKNIDDYMNNQLNSLNKLVTNVELINTVKNFDPSNTEILITAFSIISSELYRTSQDVFGFIGLDVCTTSEMVSYLQYRVTTGNINTSKIMQEVLGSPERIRFFGTIKLEEPDKNQYYKYSLENGKGVILSAKIKDHTNGQVVGMGILSFSESSLCDVIYKSSVAGGNNVYITDQNGVIISNNNKNLLGQNDNSSITKTINELERDTPNDRTAHNFNIKIDNRNFLVYYSISETTGWRTISITDYDNLIAEIDKNYMTSLMVIGVMTIMLFLISIVVTKTITIPLNKITQAMHKTSVENAYPVVEVTGNDEISYLGDTFNSMSKRIQDLIMEINEVHSRERQAEFKALQSQINPHFLYNTLDSVNWLAYLSGNLEICKIVDSLSKFFRLSLNKGNDFYTIADEVKHVKSYINILKIKHLDSISFSIDVDDQCLKYKTIRILLQPLVENAVYHGIEPKGGNGNIIIRIYKHKNTIKMDVIDDGVGIDTQTQWEIENSFDLDKKKIGYGMANIDERIKLFFGNDYGLFIESNKPFGTKVTIVIPLIDKGKLKGRIT